MASDGFPYPVDLPGNFNVAEKPEREPDAIDNLLDRLDMAAVVLDEAAPHCAEHVREAMLALECSRLAHLMASITEIIAICEQDARDQDLNKSGSRNPSSKAYAEGRGTACKGIAARLRALLPDAS